MSHPHPRTAARGFTLVEALVVIAIATVVLSLGVPRLRDYIYINRLKSLNSQLVTDLQYARQEALTRGVPVFMSLGSNGSMTCYTIFSNSNTSHGTDCNCVAAAGARCTAAGLTELRTVQVPIADRVIHMPETVVRFAFDPVTGGIFYATTDFTTPTGVALEISTFRSDVSTLKLMTQVSPGGRPTVCSAGGTIKEYPAC